MEDKTSGFTVAHERGIIPNVFDESGAGTPAEPLVLTEKPHAPRWVLPSLKTQWRRRSWSFFLEAATPLEKRRKKLNAGVIWQRKCWARTCWVCGT